MFLFLLYINKYWSKMFKYKSSSQLFIYFYFFFLFCRVCLYNGSEWKCDIYSFGVLVLEVLMGKHPSKLITDLHSSVGASVHLKNVLDNRLSPPTSQKIVDELAQMLNLAVSCICVNPVSANHAKCVSSTWDAGF